MAFGKREPVHRCRYVSFVEERLRFPVCNARYCDECVFESMRLPLVLPRESTLPDADKNFRAKFFDSRSEIQIFHGIDLSTRTFGVTFSCHRFVRPFFSPFFFSTRATIIRGWELYDTPRCSSIGKSGKEQWRWPVIVDLIEIGCNNCVVDRSFRHPLLNQNWRVHPRSMQINLTVLRTNISQNWWRKIIWRSEAY